MDRADRLEAITVCVGYDDFLRESARYNSHHFDRWIVVTEPGDTLTREVCRKFNLECVLTEDGKRHGAPFNKGRMIERGLQQTSADGFRIHLDADMVLPNQFRTLCETADLQKDTIYGVDRMLCKSWEEWQRVQKSGFLNGGHYEFHCYVKTDAGLSLGQRWAHPQMGYCPIGAFQLWHSAEDEWKGIRVKPYPMAHGNACRSDIRHALRWDRHKRQLIPEILAVHLESQPAKMGANWNGRTTRRFGPPPPKGGPEGGSC